MNNITLISDKISLSRIGFILLILICSNLFAQQKYKSERNADIVEYTSRDGLPTTNISNIVETKDGFIWISSVDGTFRFDGYEFAEVGSEVGLPGMQSVLYDSTKDILYFASPHKFIIFEKNEFKSFDKNSGYETKGIDGRVISFIKSRQQRTNLDWM